MEYEKCYVFHPGGSRPAKRRKTDGKGLQSSWHLRKSTYEKTWREQQEQIRTRLDTINSATIAEIASFLDENKDLPRAEKIPAGLILAGANSALRSSIVAQVSAQNGSKARRSMISMSSSTCTNLKNMLKTIIQKTTSRGTDDAEDELEERATTRRGTKLLNYDLQILCDHVEERRLLQVVIAFDDTEAFDSELLSELIELLACWQDRIPFAFLFNVATSVEFLQQRLSRAAVKCLDGRIFDAAISTDETEQVFEALVDPKSSIWLGPNLMTSMLDRQSDYIQGIDSLQDAAQYAYMCQHYANATSLFLDPSVTYDAISIDHFEALRMLPSFRKLAKELLDSNDTKRLRGLLDSDKALFDFTKLSVAEGRSRIAHVLPAIEAIQKIQEHVPYTQVSSKSGLYIQATLGKLAGSPLLRSLLLSLKKLPSDAALNVIIAVEEVALPQDVLSELAAVKDNLATLVQNPIGAGQPLRSEDDLKNSTLRTTVVAQKVELSKQKSTLSKQDAAYTAVVRRFADVLESYFASVLVHPRNLAMNEIFIYDLRSPYREVFTPRPRHAIERALAAPHDYLDCECCAPDHETEEATLAGSQPATAILYQLYLESGNLINASDLWQAFQAVIDDNVKDETAAMALFQRAMAELKYLGLLKSTRKKADHVAKVAWRGL